MQSSLYTPEQIAFLVASAERGFNGFRVAVNVPHAAVHNAVGGDMRNPGPAPNDWQDLHPTLGDTFEGNRDPSNPASRDARDTDLLTTRTDLSTRSLFPNLTARNAMWTTGGGWFCYRYSNGPAVSRLNVTERRTALGRRDGRGGGLVLRSLMEKGGEPSASRLNGTERRTALGRRDGRGGGLVLRSLMDKGGEPSASRLNGTERRTALGRRDGRGGGLVLRSLMDKGGEPSVSRLNGTERRTALGRRDGRGGGFGYRMSRSLMEKGGGMGVECEFRSREALCLRDGTSDPSRAPPSNDRTDLHSLRHVPPLSVEWLTQHGYDVGRVREVEKAVNDVVDHANAVPGYVSRAALGRVGRMEEVLTWPLNGGGEDFGVGREGQGWEKGGGERWVGMGDGEREAVRQLELAIALEAKGLS
ncbi:hypothetical protein HDU67_000875 [Dinochytrium kinnereticum]|nr:hypothetical protein HDU67_000875 [Dinochytrium kinnereticum]